VMVRMHRWRERPEGAPTPARGEELSLHDGTAVRLHAVAAVPGDERAEIAAVDADGRIVGRVTYARVYGPRAEVALDVDAAFWHLGLPRALLDRSRDRAACLGISTFLARVPASDVRLLALLRHEFAASESRHGQHVDVEFSTAPPPDVRVNHGA
jgi:GNAT superfamily N-acetyltransferase